ncbi:iron-containing alcohol dehydrogenase family protein [Paenibacillus sp. HW567]|uniref:iron-containing alcohol dehydrogenase family protein n=1 Tax=Paenibacillus sp. HW567 TaxID=1034769 RepID=UPI00036E6F31|nr:iron-containing alcohol dehydrogenase family protein [Paenibacillus sp. HW567]
MLTIKSPEVYIHETNALQRAGELAVRLGRKAYLIGGVTALSKVEKILLESLAAAGITVITEPFRGEASRTNIELFTQRARLHRPDFLIGAGGGRVLDLVKAVGERANLPVVAVPTVAATCAAWSALSILYDEEGRSDGAITLKASPVIVLADAAVLADSPKRYLASGIGDTLVKWYEVAINLREGDGALDLRLGLQPAKLALEVLEQYGPEVYRGTLDSGPDKAFHEVVDAIIALTGLAGSVGGPQGRTIVAHAVHDSLTFLPETHDTLHGEKIAFCLLVQSILEGRRDTEDIAAVLHQYDLPLTLHGLGIRENIDAKISLIAEGTRIVPPAAGLAFPVDPLALAKAIAAADVLGQTFLTTY